jgi:DNA-binding MarR family transcriptional regulator
MKGLNISSAVLLAEALRRYNKASVIRLTIRQLAILLALFEMAGNGAKPVSTTSLFRGGFARQFRINYPLFKKHCATLVEAGYLNRYDRPGKQYTYISYSLTISGNNVINEIETIFNKLKRVKK